MVRVNCDYIPAWPIVYYVKKSYTILHLLWPAITWKESKNGNKVFAFFYIFFRLAWNESKETQFVDFFWPIIHLEYSGRGFRFGIRPLFWIISTDRTFKLTLLALLLHVVNSDKRFYMHILPFLFIHRKVSNGTTHVNIAGLFHVMTTDSKRFYMHILPFLFINRKSSGTLHVNFMVVMHYRRTSSGTLFVLAPFLFVYHGTSNFFLFIVPLLLVSRSKSRNIIVKLVKERTFTLLLPVFVHWTNGDDYFVNVLALFTQKCRTRRVVATTSTSCTPCLSTNASRMASSLAATASIHSDTTTTTVTTKSSKYTHSHSFSTPICVVLQREWCCCTFGTPILAAHQHELSTSRRVIHNPHWWQQAHRPPPTIHMSLEIRCCQQSLPLAHLLPTSSRRRSHPLAIARVLPKTYVPSRPCPLADIRALAQGRQLGHDRRARLH
ncbi:hypothetical protein DFA_01624 [Cavenderia fasciculata]|uniref:Uncharacterized protein n=1 Tax=Cavenderia fasciculata TaxID=261658 RepID=F4PTR8_CACFS|nr:uncharacterized protein DFA_01624 [Cavenderia fasciculata]EGG21738.1 hypothetical protein DFA_01624 [Cavenderia fasciculata]|eukprot:XP_004359588.1 hypothetical protein DFA_01624 [Cavenderia fasciculata]